MSAERGVDAGDKVLLKRRSRLLVASVLLVLLTIGVARAQHWFVHKQLHETTKQELSARGSAVSREILVRRKWAFEEYLLRLPRCFGPVRSIEREQFAPSGEMDLDRKSPRLAHSVTGAVFRMENLLQPVVRMRFPANGTGQSTGHFLDTFCVL